MPKRTDIRKILLIGSGPIVIGQACEFDYSGTQACKALREEGFEVVLVNSNPATIMTDPEMADRTYVEPLTPEVLEHVIATERPQALLPTLGGQTGLNLAVALAERGVLARYGVELIGAKLEAIKKAEDRELFKAAMQRIGLALPRSGYARSIEQAREVVREVGYPAIIRPSTTSSLWCAATTRPSHSTSPAAKDSASACRSSRSRSAASSSSSTPLSGGTSKPRWPSARTRHSAESRLRISRSVPIPTP